MKSGLHIGHTGELTWIVDPTMTITLGGRPDATVFSTPNMIMLMERTAREALRPFLEPGEETVGIEVHVEHLGPAALGQTVRGEARVTALDGRRIEFDIAAFQGERQIGRGHHKRAVVPLERIVENIAKTSESMDSAMNLKPDPGELPTFEHLRTEQRHGVMLVTFHRPSVLNAINARMTSELERLVAWLAGHPEQVRVVIFTGAGDAFSAGDDVKELPSFSVEQARAISLRQANLYLALERLPQPTIAAVNGPAFGAGCVAAYSCDLRLASHAARFGMPEIKLGWPPGYGVAQLIALVGKARALELCLLGETISATQALEWGLINELVPGVMLLDRAHALAVKMIELPAEALRATKRLIHADEGALPKVTHRADTEAYIRSFQLPDAKEGIAAFIEKRKPRFQAKS